ncbi:DUF2190 family protein [bacterium 1XD42-1]|nr:DUF2190 family protein [bacterium 1XD42-8]RKJ60425.1 DUF2190 family protein [bacterium 1XD42-1]
MIMKDIIKSKRLALGLSQENLAKRLGVSLTGIYEMETAETIGYGDAVYWDAANKTVTKTADKNIPAGMAASETGASGGKIAVRID